jgi:hypothetical protein
MTWRDRLRALVYDKSRADFRLNCQNCMDQTDHVANTEKWIMALSEFSGNALINAQLSLIDSANEFAYLIENQQQ